jgi:hypothetical protein
VADTPVRASSKAEVEVNEFTLRSACGRLEERTQRLLKLPRDLDERFKMVAFESNVSVSALLRAVMADGIESGRALSLAEEIRQFEFARKKE